MKRIITMLLCVCLLCSSTLYFAEEPISGADGEVVTVTQNTIICKCRVGCLQTAGISRLPWKAKSHIRFF